MYGKFDSQWLNFSMGVLEPVVSINKIMIHTAERLTNKQIDLEQDHLDVWRQQMRLLADMKDRPLSLADEGKLIAGYSNRIIERAEEFLSIASDAKQSLMRVAAESRVGPTSGIAQERRVTAKAA